MTTRKKVPLPDLSDPRSPAWIGPVRTAMKRLMDLEPDWDSYGASPIAPQNVDRALQLLDIIMDDDIPPPSIVPTAAGGVQMEWHSESGDLEIDIAAPDRVSAFFEDGKAHVQWEQEQVGDHSDLREALVRLFVA